MCRIDLSCLLNLKSLPMCFGSPQLWESQTRPSTPKRSGPRCGRLIWERPSPARPASLPFFARTVCMAPESLSKCFWDLGLTQGLWRGPLPAAGSAQAPGPVTHGSQFLSAFTPKGALGSCRAQPLLEQEALFTLSWSPVLIHKGKRLL